MLVFHRILDLNGTLFLFGPFFFTALNISTYQPSLFWDGFFDDITECLRTYFVVDSQHDQLREVYIKQWLTGTCTRG